MNSNFSDFGMGGPNILFMIVPIFIFLTFILVFGIIIFSFIKGAKQWNKNNHSPVLTVDATVIAKRTDISHHNYNAGNNTMDHTSYSSRYYATFEVESKDRMELLLSGEEYGLLIEGDKGRLTFQGTRFLKFERI